jgi:hypothetical protein
VIPEPPETPADDAAIGRALKRSLLVLLAVGGVAGGTVWLVSRPAARPVGHVTPLGAPQQSQRRAEVPKVRFTDVTAAAGIRFRHENGARGQKLLPETMGGGVVWFDCDGDGDADLLCVNSTWWPDDPRRNDSSAGRPPTHALYRNDTAPGGEPRFTDITAGSGFDVAEYAMGAAAGDFDGDGRTDVYLTCVGPNRLLRNLGSGRFADVTAETGTAGGPADWSTAAAWVDVDNDGDLDLFVGNYVQWSPQLDFDVNNQLVGIGRAYGRPWNFSGSLPRLYRNDSQGSRLKFMDVSAESGLQMRNPATGLPMAKTLAVAPVDLNDDGWIDLVVANDTVQNFVFTNRHDSTFAEVGVASGVAFDAYGQARGAMGIDVARFRNDDRLGIAIGNFANEMNALYVAQRDSPRDQLLFSDEAITEGIGPASRQLLKFGLFFFDYDLDGRLDVLTANGHIEADIQKVQAGVRYRQPAQLFWNAGGAPSFVEVGAAESGEDLFHPLVGRGSAYADFDRDGDLDVVLMDLGGTPRLLRNDQATGHYWLRIVALGRSANRNSVGAWVTVESGPNRQSLQVMPTKSYLSQSELPLTFGLGRAAEATRVTVAWPGGRSRTLERVAAGQIIEILEPEAGR